jgi:uncharacterized protein DUF6600
MTISQKAPGQLSRRRVHTAGPAATAVLFLVALCSLALADDPVFRVARISLVEGEVSHQRSNSSGSSGSSGDSGKDWFDATLNLPLEENDQLYSGSDGKAEIQLSGRNVVRISRETNLRFTQFNAGAIQMALPIGSAYFRIDSLDKRQFDVVDANDAGINDPVYFEVDTPTVAVTLVKEGVYRINVDEDGSTEVIVRKGQAEVYGQEIGTVVVKKGKRVIVEGREDLYQLTGLEDEDDWDRWNDDRDNGLFSGVDSSDSARYIPVSVPGAYDLDNYGEWIDTPEYGRMWRPRGVADDWAPYRDGCWRWFPSYGWTWISYEPWGWTPYHYGRWAYVRDRWCWAPVVNVGPVLAWRWRPHHVVFFGWGGSYNRGYRDGYYDGYWKGFRDGRYGWLGWCPLGPRDRHYGPRDSAPRLEALGNFHAPGAVSGMEARRFAGGRAAVSRDALKAPRGELIAHLRGERDGGRGRERDFAAPAFVRNEDLKPLQQIAPTRSDAVARGRVARRIEAPIVFRRTPGGATPSGWRQIREGRSRDGQTTPGSIRRGDDPNQSTPTRVPNERIERPSRMPDYRRPERVDAPPPRPRESRDPKEPKETDRIRSERAIERDKENNNPPRDEAPSRSERRSDDDSRRDGPPAWRRGERRDEQRQPEGSREMRRADPPSHDNSPTRETRRPDPPRNDDTPRRNDPPEGRRGERREEHRDQDQRREMRRADPPPSRESSPPREPRRDDQQRDNSSRREMRRADPPSRESSPPRSVERPSLPPPQTAPARAPERQQSPPPRPAERLPERPKPNRPNIR